MRKATKQRREHIIVTLNSPLKTMKSSAYKGDFSKNAKEMTEDKIIGRSCQM